MSWRKLGLVFVPPAGSDWMVTHAALPVVDPLDKCHRVFFSSRDALGRSQIGAFDVASDEPGRILAVREMPVLGLGPLGAFDDSGVTSSCLVTHGGRKYLYYSGWSLGVTVPFYLHVGLAVSDDGGETFRRVSTAPVLDRTASDPYMSASPWILIEDAVWRMWYVSGTGWHMVGGRPRHAYHIKYCESRDGVSWERRGMVCVDYAGPDEYAFGRPCLVKDGDVYQMWYSYRGDRYRIGHATSADGLRWARDDGRVGIDVSPGGWDSDMVTYPCVFDSVGRRYMFYNGNEYGRTGIGLAVLEPSRQLAGTPA